MVNWFHHRLMDTITIVGPQSAIAAIPEILGFRPRDSLVVLWVVDGRVVLGQRVDIPGCAHASWGSEVVGCARYSKATSALDVWVAETPPNQAIVGSIHEELSRARISRIASIATDGERWYAEGPPFTERQYIPASLRWVGPERGEFRVDPVPDQLLECSDVNSSERVTLSESEVDRFIINVMAMVDQKAPECSRDETLQLVTLLNDVRVRDSLLWHVSQRIERPRSVADMLARILRTIPSGASRELPITCAMSYWMAGDGFRASVALQRCLDEDPQHVLGQMLGVALQVGLPPDAWVRAARDMPYEECARRAVEADRQIPVAAPARTPVI